MRWPSLFVIPVMVLFGISVAPTAQADCTTSGNTTVCGIGGMDNGPVVPFPCDDSYDYYQNDWECDDLDSWDVDLDADPGPGVGLPGRPGNRPGGGGGGRPGGGGGGRR